ncbi:hypothetical protein GCM10010145_33860 [Streptomyces ruber]|uniref:Uncharacterized protein n=2 Tax=Streptomyces TaxID=1883 RepID=A0A918BDK9_9ACTN|nr:hypothetical protein GCM10010145_33860 [Streptomyces ruber]
MIWAVTGTPASMTGPAGELPLVGVADGPRGPAKDWVPQVRCAKRGVRKPQGSWSPFEAMPRGEDGRLMCHHGRTAYDASH